jgi:aminoglycoside phosphotransferase (APT) family kinase protein
MPEWDAEIEVDRALAQRLISQSFPDLDSDELELVGAGWDNTVWVTGDQIAFRFPRREIALPGIAREIALLPKLEPLLPFRIPNAGYPGSPGPLFPWQWFGSRLIDGEELAESPIGADRRGDLASDLGAFLRTLHQVSLPELNRLPVDPLGRADLGVRVPRTRALLAQLDPSGALDSRAEEILLGASQLPAAEDCVLTHGDLHSRHTLVDDHGRLAGVIDWGDICRGPAAVDLNVYWGMFTAPGRQRFLAAYGDVDADMLVRARVLALFLNAMLLLYALTEKMPALAAESRNGIERTLSA